ncbi:MAG: response regulator [Bacteroidales bacterium]
MIYIIEDDKYVRRGFELLLTSSGYEFNTFKSGDEFLGSYNYCKNDVIILDLGLEGMQGCEIIMKINELDKKVPVIVVTASPDVTHRELCLKLGVLAFVRKPVDSDILLGHIHSALELNLNYNI